MTRFGGLINSQNNQGKVSTSKKASEPKSFPKEISKPNVAIETVKKNTVTDKKIVKKKTKNTIQKDTVKTINRETKSTQKSIEAANSKDNKENNAGKGQETALIGKEGNLGPGENQTPGTASARTELAYPNYNLNPKPKYPRAARKRGFEGEVKLKVFVLENGKVGKIEVAQPSGHQILDESALDAVKDWVFTSGKENGKEISSWVTVPITFQLKSG